MVNKWDHDKQCQCRSCLQTLAVAVHNHYKRVRHETSRRRLKEQQAASAQNGGAVASFVQSGKVTRSILETTTGPPPTPHSAQTAPHSYPHDRFPFPPTPEAGRIVPPCVTCCLSADSFRTLAGLLHMLGLHKQLTAHFAFVLKLETGLCL